MAAHTVDVSANAGDDHLVDKHIDRGATLGFTQSLRHHQWVDVASRWAIALIDSASARTLGSMVVCL